MAMSAYTVLDSANKYRHGVLIGNFNEDKFGKDLQEKGPNQSEPHKCTTKQTHNLESSLYQKHPLIKNCEEQTKTFYQTAKQIDQAEYQRPQNQTTYNIFHRQEVFRKVPILENNPKKQERQIKEDNQYSNTRYYLSNKFIKDPSNGNGAVFQGTYTSGLKGDEQAGQIPDILTGQIWKSNNNKVESKKNEEGDNCYGEEKVATKLGAIGAKSLNPYGTSSIVKPQIQKFEEVEYRKFVLPHDKGEHRDVMFGHGLNINEFHRRQLATTYDLSYNQQIKPQTQVNSFYNPDFNQSAKKFHNETVYQKNYQPNIPQYSEKTILGNEKLGRPYDPYTKTFDKNHKKNQYLRQPI